MSLVDPRRDPPSEHSGRSEVVTAPTCHDVIELLLDYLEPALDPETRAALERHFQDCAPCLAYRRTYERSRRLVGDVTRGELPEELKMRLRALLLGRLRLERS